MEGVVLNVWLPLSSICHPENLWEILCFYPNGRPIRFTIYFSVYSEKFLNVTKSSLVNFG